MCESYPIMISSCSDPKIKWIGLPWTAILCHTKARLWQWRANLALAVANIQNSQLQSLLLQTLPGCVGEPAPLTKMSQLRGAKKLTLRYPLVSSNMVGWKMDHSSVIFLIKFPFSLGMFQPCLMKPEGISQLNHHRIAWFPIENCDFPVKKL